ncbi:MAG: hypothetical protein JNM96_05400, partial [Bacteroidia bacterium]|nr:hypothetical protein [Bacteroidia bacterium]
NVTAGTGFFIAAGSGPQIGVRGSHFGTTGSYKFGVYGDFSSTAIRCGAVFGDDFGFAMGALGYYAANLVDYGVYGFGSAYATGVATGKVANNNETGVGLNEQNTNIGLGIYGGVMGGWVRGLQYGFHAKGNRYGLYVDGVTFTNKPVAQLIDAGQNSRTAVYTNNSTTSDVYAKGKAILVNGTATIIFDDKFKGLIDNPQDLVITVTPNGNTNGVYVATVNANGFTIVENNGGTRSDVTVSWIAATEIKQNKNIEIPSEVAAEDFDTKMRGVMFNDNNKTDAPQPLWYDGSKIRFDQPPAKKARPAVKVRSLSGNISTANTQ